ncbi:MAG: hemerythrin domain-containing protein [Myxococcales bacterium]|nr:hemerythrin domain-containing protein [Myxococcales bacterium]
MTVSVGVAELLVGEDLAGWFERADRAVYAAKAAGRNRVSCDRRGASDVWSNSRHGVLELVFRDRYRSGDPAIDREHAQLFELANKVLASSAVGYDDPSQLRLALDELIHHVRLHFAHEESLLAELGYPRLAAHRLSHARLLGEAVRLQTAAAGRRVPPGELVDFLARDVVARHLLVADREFFPLLSGAVSTQA